VNVVNDLSSSLENKRMSLESKILGYEGYQLDTNSSSIAVLTTEPSSKFTGLYSVDGNPLYRVERRYPMGYIHAYD
jgi:hypothetical protein